MSAADASGLVLVYAIGCGLGLLVSWAFYQWVVPALAARRARRAEQARRAEAIRRAEEVRRAEGTRRVAATHQAYDAALFDTKLTTRRPFAVAAERGPASEPRELCSICTERPAVVWLHLVPESQDQLARRRVCLECHRVVRRSWAIASGVRRVLAQDAVAGEVDARDVQPGGAR